MTLILGKLTYFFIIVTIICFLGVFICLIRIMYLSNLEKKDIASKKELLNTNIRKTLFMNPLEKLNNNLETIITSSKLSVKELN